MADEHPLDMSPEEFRRWGHATIDWIAHYLETVEQHPVRSPVEPGAIRERLPAEPPRTGEPFDRMLKDVETVVLPGLTHWQSPNFFAYFPANSSGPSILGELLAAGLGVQGMLWTTSPACTEVETRVLDWLVGMLDLPAAFHSESGGGGVIQDTASSAALCALLAARERCTDSRSNQQGCAQQVGPTLTAYTSTEAHSSILKAVRIAGIGAENLRMVEVDDTLAMRPEALRAAIEADLAAGRRPFFVSATLGTTSSNAFDPLTAIGPLCREHGLWLHVDAAMAGTAALCPEHRSLQAGLEHADSYCFNPHKWMFTNFDCDCFWVADRGPLIEALSIQPEYLRNQATESGAVIDYRDWHVPLGRRFRALKLWFVIRHYGVEGLQAKVREHVGLAQELAGWVQAHPDFELAVPAPLNLVCFRHRGGDEMNERLLAALNDSGKLYLTHTKIHGRFTLRMVVGQTRTARRHVGAAWAQICQTAAALA